MKTCVGSLIALAALQLVCSTPYYSHQPIGYIEDIEEADSNIDIDGNAFGNCQFAFWSVEVRNNNLCDYKGSVKTDLDTVGLKRCTQYLCCPKIYSCGPNNNCVSMMKIKFTRPMMICPIGVVELTA